MTRDFVPWGSLHQARNSYSSKIQIWTSCVSFVFEIWNVRSSQLAGNVQWQTKEIFGVQNLVQLFIFFQSSVTPECACAFLKKISSQKIEVQNLGSLSTESMKQSRLFLHEAKFSDFSWLFPQRWNWTKVIYIAVANVFTHEKALYFSFLYYLCTWWFGESKSATKERSPENFATLTLHLCGLTKIYFSRIQMFSLLPGTLVISETTLKNKSTKKKLFLWPQKFQTSNSNGIKTVSHHRKNLGDQRGTVK